MDENVASPAYSENEVEVGAAGQHVVAQFARAADGPAAMARKRKAPPKSMETSKRTCQDTQLLNNLVQQVSSIQNFLQSIHWSHNGPAIQQNQGNFDARSINDFDRKDDDVISLNASGDLFDGESGQQPPQLHENFSLNLQTTLKEPSIAKSDKTRLEKLKNIQHFESTDWSEVRYSEAQKRFCSTPGFTSLECNDEIKPYDKFNHLAITEKGFAAITQGLMRQQEAVEVGFQSLMSWFRSSEIVDLSSIENKISEIFSDEFQKISNELLQMACGHRADLIEQRRDAILRSVKDKFVIATFRRIPPNCEYLFTPKTFSETVEKQGGMSKIFWPLKAQNSKPLSQGRSSTPKGSKTPSQSEGLSYAWSNSTRMMAPAHGVTFQPLVYSPAQGAAMPMYNPNFTPGLIRAPAQGQPFRSGDPKSSDDKTKSITSRRGKPKRKF
ncbi:hypothetical protein NE865_07584 [Phthorimaea operculella]|nr:hypothetical protein NE865_07584 [Phthorimaea operculella]